MIPSLLPVRMAVLFADGLCAELIFGALRRILETLMFCLNPSTKSPWMEILAQPSMDASLRRVRTVIQTTAEHIVFLNP